MKKICLLITLEVLAFYSYAIHADVEILCRPGRKNFPTKECKPFTEGHAQRATEWFLSPPKTTCRNVTISQGIQVCKDRINYKGCVGLSVIVSKGRV